MHVRAEGVQRGVQSGRVHYVVLCVRLRQNRVISSTQGSTVAVLWQHASVAGSAMVSGKIRGTEMVQERTTLSSRLLRSGYSGCLH